MCLVWSYPLPTHTQKLVLLALADNANDEGLCWPGLETIADKCCLSRQGVIDQIKNLQESNLLDVTNGGGRWSNKYQFNLDKLAKPPVNAVDPNHHLTIKEPSIKEGEFFSKETIGDQNKPELPAKPWNPTPEMLRLGRLFSRRPTTRWDAKELKAYKSISGQINEDDFQKLEAFYAADWPASKDYRIRDLGTLLNNWNKALDRARQFKSPTCF
jgi:hypothetical protein